MRLFVLLALVTSSVFASEYQATKLKFSFYGDNFGNRIYMRCESAKKIVESRLADLGAQNVEVKCAGGLENWGTSTVLIPVNLSASFDVPAVQENPTVRNVEITAGRVAHQDCHFNTQFMKKALPLFPTVKVLKKRASCSTNESRWSYSVEVAE